MLLVLLLFFVMSFPVQLFSQEQDTTKVVTGRVFNSTADKGWYLDNRLRGKWNPFGVMYQASMYYRQPLHREQNSFWFADSALHMGMEQSLSVASRTSVFLFWQPVIAVNFLFKMGYTKDFVQVALLNGKDDDYSHAYPPFTGLNPGNRKPVRANTDILELEFTPTFTFGGPAGNGMLAVIYSPSLLYLHAFGISADQYYFFNRDAIVLKAQDIFWKHDIKLGYSLSHLGLSVALVNIIEHIQSISGIFRGGVFSAVSYEKTSLKFPAITPYFRTQLGMWWKDRYMKNQFAIQFETGFIWKFD